MILISFPHNPTTVCVDMDFMREIVELARQYGSYIIHDFAYAELGLDGTRHRASCKFGALLITR